MGEATKKRIVKAAREIIIKRGKEGARMSEIADHAGVNKALLHYYFNTKDELYQKILETVTKKVLMIPSKLSFESPFKENLRNFIDLHLDFVKENRELFRFIVWELKSAREKLRKAFRNVLTGRNREPVKMLKYHIKDSIRKKEIKEVDPLHLLITIVSLNVFVVVGEPIIKTILDLEETDFEQFIEQRKKENFEIVWNYIKK